MPKATKLKACKPLVSHPLGRWFATTSRGRKETNAETLIKTLKGLFEANVNPKQAVQMKMYLRNQYEMYGLKSPERRALAKRVTMKYLEPDVEMVRAVLALAWQEDKREFQAFAIDYAIANKTTLSGDNAAVCVESTECIKTLLTTKSWWDTVDMLASNVIGPFVTKHPDDLLPLMDEWILSDDMWLRRTAILHQLSYKNKTDQARLFKYCLLCCHEREFFIQKAIGWALRNYFRTSPSEVKKFVKKNESKLAKLSIREALKHA